MTPVLIVDDSLTVRMDLAEAFQGAGFATQLCATVAEARRALCEGPLLLIVLDVLLPDGDGIELMREIKGAAATAGVPVMLLSTEAEVRDRLRGLGTGADEYLGKPYDAAHVVARAKELARRGQPEPPAGTAPVVLIIDDSITSREELRAALLGAGYDVVVAATGEEGLQAAVDVRPAAMIVDGVLPGIDGATVIRRVRGDAALRRTPCLLLTASADRDDELRALDAGADLFVRKEEDSEIILARLAAMLRAGGSPAALDASDSLLGPKRVLVVDDSPTYLQELAGELSQEGYDVVLAHSGEEALELLAVQPVDAILLDLIMPGLSGQESCRRIKGSPRWRSIPLILLTVLEDRRAMIEGINAGADDYITKSADFAVLKARLLAQLRRKQFEDENSRIRERLLRQEIEAGEARAAREMAAARAALLLELEARNGLLEETILSERKAHEALKHAQAQLVQAEKLAGLGQMVAGVAHEINNPLAFVTNNMAVLQRDMGSVRDVLLLYQEAAAVLAREMPAHWGRIEALCERIDLAYTLENFEQIMVSSREGLRRIRSIVQDLRDFARMDERERAEVDLNVGIETTLIIVRSQAKDVGVELVATLGELPQVWCYPAKINQVVLNLLVNAIDSCAGGGRVVISTSAGSDEVLIEVSDTGQGIDPAIQGRIFDPFFTTKPIGKGTGLGLSISYGIVKDHGGTIEVDSTLGRGSRFTVRLPLRPAGV